MVARFKKIISAAKAKKAFIEKTAFILLLMSAFGLYAESVFGAIWFGGILIALSYIEGAILRLTSVISALGNFTILEYQTRRKEQAGAKNKS